MIDCSFCWLLSIDCYAPSSPLISSERLRRFARSTKIEAAVPQSLWTLVFNTYLRAARSARYSSERLTVRDYLSSELQWSSCCAARMPRRRGDSDCAAARPKLSLWCGWEPQVVLHSFAQCYIIVTQNKSMHRYVLQVTEGSAAARAGLVEGDEVLSVNGTSTSGLAAAEVLQLVRDADAQIRLRVLRYRTVLFADKCSIFVFCASVESSLKYQLLWVWECLKFQTKIPPNV